MKYGFIIFVLFCVALVAIWVLIGFFGTEEYDCIAKLNKGKIIELYQNSGQEAKVWIKHIEPVPFEDDLWHLELMARENGGEHDIDNLLNKIALGEYQRLD